MKCLELRDVTYRYEGGSETVLKKVSAEFECGYEKYFHYWRMRKASALSSSPIRKT